MAGQDKKLYKEMSSEADSTAEVALLSSAAGSPGSWQNSADLYASHYGNPGTPLSGPSEPLMQYAVSRKTLYYLKATLNTAFAPDYDFSNCKPSEFVREPSVDWVSRKIDANYMAAMGDEYAQVAASLWRAIGDEIDPQECSIYSYVPDMESDPFNEEGVLWSFDFLLYNKKMKRIVFFACRAMSLSSPQANGEDEMFLDDPQEEEGLFDGDARCALSVCRHCRDGSIWPAMLQQPPVAQVIPSEPLTGSLSLSALQRSF